MATVGGLWFNPRNLGNYVSSAVLERGLTLYRGQKVLDMEVRAIDHGRWQLGGKVQGSERTPYTLSIRLHINVHGMLTHWDADCTCPVGVDCKHAVALSLKAAYRTQATTNATPPKPPTDAELAAARLATEQRARDAAALKVRQWLAQFDALERSSSPLPDGRMVEQFVYVLGPTASAKTPQILQLQLQKTYQKKNGDWAKPKSINTAPYPGQELFDAASPPEQELLRLLKSMASQGNLYGYAATQTAVLQDAAGLLALQLAADTGRLFSQADGGYLGAPLRWAAPLDLAWHWQEAPPHAGSEPVWTLQAQLASPSAQIYANHPPLYLDAAQGCCGLAQTPGIPAAQLPLLLNAPPMPQSAIEPLQLPLTRRLAAVAMPPTLQPLATVQGVVPTGTRCRWTKKTSPPTACCGPGWLSTTPGCAVAGNTRTTA